MLHLKKNWWYFRDIFVKYTDLLNPSSCSEDIVMLYCIGITRGSDTDPEFACQSVRKPYVQFSWWT